MQMREAETNEEQDAGLAVNDTVTDGYCPLCHARSRRERRKYKIYNFIRHCYHHECTDLSIDTYNILGLLAIVAGET